ncbi:hypothetical protein BJX76DRAFT_358825 [Aspergillus varians]
MASNFLPKGKLDRLRDFKNRYLSGPAQSQDVEVVAELEAATAATQGYAIGNVKVEDLMEAFDIHESSDRAFEPLPGIPIVNPPDDLLSMLDRLHRCIGQLDMSSENESLARSRIDIIIMTAVDVVQQSIRHTTGPLMKLRYETPIKCTTMNGGIVRNFTGRADYCLGHGKVDQQENNLAVIEAKKYIDLNKARPQLLGYMASIRELRYQERKQYPGLYGIVTDGRYWEFYHLARNGGYSYSLRNTAEPNYNGRIETIGSRLPGTFGNQFPKLRDQNWDEGIYGGSTL